MNKSSWLPDILERVGLNLGGLALPAWLPWSRKGKAGAEVAKLRQMQREFEEATVRLGIITGSRCASS